MVQNFSHSEPPPPIYKHPWDYNAPTQIIQGNLFIFRPLTTPAKFLLPYKATYSQILGSGRGGRLLGGWCSALHGLHHHPGQTGSSLNCSSRSIRLTPLEYVMQRVTHLSISLSPAFPDSSTRQDCFFFVLPLVVFPAPDTIPGTG